jgi:putative FmdB family regulatory protein
MPTYEYACRKCGEHLEVVQSFSDDPLTECPNCGGDLKKVFGNIGIVFKGSGFYKTDSRSSTKSGQSKPDAAAATSSDKPAADTASGSKGEAPSGSAAGGPKKEVSSNGSTSNPTRPAPSGSSGSSAAAAT